MLALSRRVCVWMCSYLGNLVSMPQTIDTATSGANLAERPWWSGRALVWETPPYYLLRRYWPRRDPVGMFRVAYGNAGTREPLRELENDLAVFQEDSTNVEWCRVSLSAYPKLTINTLPSVHY